jgi:HD-like signal output (HDOD) protein
MQPGIDETELNAAITEARPIEYRVPHVSLDVKLSQRTILKTIMRLVNRSFLADSLAYILEEFLSNADKANIKRVYFEVEKLDIRDPKSYEKGMTEFAGKMVENFDEYSRQLEAKGLYTRIIYQIADNVLQMKVCNNTFPTVEEALRIRSRIDKSKRIRDAGEAFMAVADNSESAGLGTITTMLVLRSMGAGEDAYRFAVDRELGETITSVTIPLNTVTQEHAEQVSEAIVQEIVSLPDYPESIAELERALTDSNVPFTKVARLIQRDPALTAEILKIVNSAQYVLPNKVSNIQNALSLIGIRGLRNLLLFHGTQNVVNEKYGKMEEMWKHAYRCASYAYNIARWSRFSALADDAYINGILHDIGKIVIMTAHPGVLEKVGNVCASKGIDTKLLESITIGISHAAVGGKIAEKWNFPESIVIPITFHHTPFLAPDHLIDLSVIIAFADNLAQLHDQKIDFSSIDREILKKFGIVSESTARALEERLNEHYRRQEAK